MKELLEAGVHFGHQTKRWNPKMREYIFGQRNGIYIINLQKTLIKFREALEFVLQESGQGGTILFVGFLFVFWTFAQRWILPSHPSQPA